MNREVHVRICEGPGLKCPGLLDYLEQRSRRSLAEVARENGVGAETLRNWVKAYEKAHPQEEEPLTVSERARLRELERENRELKLEREFLGKGAPRTLKVA